MEDLNTFEDPIREDEIDSTLLDPSHLVGTRSRVIAFLQSAGVTVTKIENVVRPDLMLDFLLMKKQFQSSGVSSKVDIAFHGTLEKNLDSIVQNGLVVPGSMGVSVRCGSTYGKGIYLSPQARVSCSYTDSCMFILCAVLMGNRKPVTSIVRGSTQIAQGYHSHVSPCGNEWVVFNAAQVVPCYVVYMRGAEVSTPTQTLVNVNTRMLLQSLTNERGGKAFDNYQEFVNFRAKKYLPHGFGPGGRKSTRIMAIAESDDDDDAYTYEMSVAKPDRLANYQGARNRGRNRSDILSKTSQLGYGSY